MKIKFRDRMILFFGGLMTLAAGCFLVVAGLQLQGALGESIHLWVRIVCIVCGVLTAAFGVYVIAFPHRRVHRQEFVVQKTDNGELRIAVKAVDNLVRKCVDLHEEVRLISMDILNARSGVTVDLSIALANNISIPLAVASLQKQIKQYLSASSGIEIKEVRVSVESTEDDLEPQGAVSAEAAAQAEEEAAPSPRKRPLHQRLFGKADQPATLPEPPKETGDQAAEQPIGDSGEAGDEIAAGQDGAVTAAAQAPAAQWTDFTAPEKETEEQGNE